MQKKSFHIAVLPGDGVGPEVVSAALQVLNAITRRFGCEFRFSHRLIGGAALKELGVPLPDDTLNACLQSNAVLLGAVGGPEFDRNPPEKKPETALLQLRKKLGVFANLRPVLMHESLVEASPLKREIVKGVDLLIVRELTGGLYFGEPRSLEPEMAFNTMRYTRNEIERIARVAFEAARQRRKKIHSVDKANVLETSQLWRKVVTEIAAEYSDVQLQHMYVDNCAMQFIANPGQFDVVLTENLFGDILSDEAAMLTGSIGLLPSASLGGDTGLYEPVHGSAPDIAGQDRANPLATIASAALMLRYSFALQTEALAIENAIQSVLSAGLRTADIYRTTGTLVTTTEMARAVALAVPDATHFAE